MGIKLNIGCGSQVLPGWVNLDHRPHIADGITEWSWPDAFPTDDESVDIIFVSYFLMYLDFADYGIFLDRCKAALSSWGWLIVREDDNRQRVWKEVGTKHSTGVIRSTTDPEIMGCLMMSARLQVFKGYPLYVQKEIETTHRHAMKSSYILTGIKYNLKEPKK